MPIDSAPDASTPDPLPEGYFAGQSGETDNPFVAAEAQFMAGPDGEVTPPDQIGDMIDAAIEEGPHEPPDTPLVDPEKPRRDTLNTGPPKADEWLDFFSRIVLKVGMDLYTDYAFRGIDESLVTENDLRRISVKKDERESIARPFAEFCAKNPYTRKHGRQVVALTDSAESIVTLGIWMRRVNRVAKKYKPKQPQRPQVRINEGPAFNGYNGSNPGNGASDQGTGGGYTVVNPGTS